MSLDAIIFMLFVFAVCIGGFSYSLYLSSKDQ